MKPSDFLTGIVKFVGKIDKDPIDHHIYVGLRLDEPSKSICMQELSYHNTRKEQVTKHE